MSTQAQLDRQLELFAERLPPKLSRFLRWLWEPSRVWVRIPLAVALVVGGFLSFLPVLGIWMLPLGLVLVARDVPFLQGPMARMLAWIEARWPRDRRSPGARGE
jgi:hypothetical protein